MEIQGSVVVVTGASSGIGLATARSFAQAGAKVVLAARSRRAPVARILPSPADQTRRWSLQLRKQTGSKTWRLHEKSYSSNHEEQDLPRCQKCGRKQRAMIVGISHAREANGEKSDPRVRFLVK